MLQSLPPLFHPLSQYIPCQFAVHWALIFKSTLHHLLCDNGVRFFKHFSFVVNISSSFVSQGPAVTMQEGEASLAGSGVLGFASSSIYECQRCM
jgi:hypothetical protein